MTVAAATIALLGAHNLAVNLWLPTSWYVPANLATTAGLVGLGLAAGFAASELGLVVAGVPVGLACAVVLCAALAILAALPGTRPFLADQRMAGVDRRGALYRALLRIPAGTVVLEEVAFRGVAPAVLASVVSDGGAVVTASVLFGAWHVIPTIKTLEVNRPATTGWRRLLVVGGAVAFTTAVGMVFSWLRSTTGSLVAPALAHWAANGGATLASFFVLQRKQREASR